jgi:hypothetical protein
LNKVYFGLATDSTRNHHYLSFENDSIAKITSRHRHMLPQQEKRFSYSSRNGIITMKSIEEDTLMSIPIDYLKLEMDKKVLLDRTNKVVYFLYEDYDKLNVTTYIIDGEKYRQKNTDSNSYGIFEKKPRRNRRLKRKMKKIEPNIDEYEIEVIKGINAYDTFGYDYIFGVIKLSRK